MQTVSNLSGISKNHYYPIFVRLCSDKMLNSNYSLLFSVVSLGFVSTALAVTLPGSVPNDYKKGDRVCMLLQLDVQVIVPSLEN